MQESPVQAVTPSDALRIRSGILSVVLIYAVFASLWILLSDNAVGWLFPDPAQMAMASTLKGWLFVMVTSLLLYGVMQRLVYPAAGRSPMLARRAALVTWPRWKIYGFAAVMTAVMLLARIEFGVPFGDRPLLILFMFPIILSALIGGFGPGLFATVFSTLGIAWLALPPFGNLPIVRVQDALQLGFLVINGVLISLLSELLHSARRESENERLTAETELAEKQRTLNLLDAITDGSTDMIYVKDTSGRYLLFNQAAEQFVGKRAAEVLDRNDSAIFPPDSVGIIQAYDRAVIERDCTISYDEEVVTLQGEKRTFLTVKGPVHDAGGKVAGLFGVSRDITERKQIEDRLRKLSQAVEQGPVSIVITDLDASIEYVNEAFVRNSGYSREEAIGKNPRFLAAGKTAAETVQAMWAALAAGRSWEGNFVNRRKDGSEHLEHAIIAPVHDEQGRFSHYLSVQQDITEKKRAEAEIHRLAYHDVLTGLPNRALLLERIEQLFPAARREASHCGLMLFNIDRFKSINDTGGQAMGDVLLKAVGERLGGMLREGDVLARLSGDEFGILLTRLAARQQAAAHQAMHVAEKIRTDLREPFRLGEAHVTFAASLGIALFPDGEMDAPLDVLRRANTALHYSKANGGGRTTFFEGGLDEIAKQRFRTELELRSAVASGQLHLYLQPQMQADGRMTGAEALVRWQHPERGLIAPGAFIPVAEESDLIVEIGGWVFTEVCRLLAREDLASYPIRLAVNISPRHFRQADFVPWVKNTLATSGADPARITLEVTEGVVIDDINDVVAKMSELAALGIHFSMDDFGTGYSSLAYLKQLPIHEIKIDKTFVQDAPSDPDDAALVEAILAVAKHMHLKVVAEGVETAEQAAFLDARAQVIHQGYLFGKPEPADRWVERLKSGR